MIRNEFRILKTTSQNVKELFECLFVVEIVEEELGKLERVLWSFFV